MNIKDLYIIFLILTILSLLSLIICLIIYYNIKPDANNEKKRNKIGHIAVILFTISIICAPLAGLLSRK